MKNYFHLCYIASLLLILPGCWFKKKEVNVNESTKENFVKEKNSSLASELENEHYDIISTGEDFSEEEREDEEISGKSIFDENEEDDELAKEDNHSYESNISVTNPLTETHGSRSLVLNNEIMSYVGLLHFDFGKDIIKPTEHAKIKIIVEDLKKKIKNATMKNLDYEIVLKGHACNFAGSRRYNLQLSDKRAQVVKKELIKHGIDSDFIISYGCGIEELVVKSGNKEQQNPNRRVEVFFVFKK